jgi:hypothetical protein
MNAGQRYEVFKEITNNSFVELSLTYARAYERNPKAFISTYKKNLSIRLVCNWIVFTYKYIGAFDECKTLGKDFTDWANRQEVDEKYKKNLAEVMLIIYSILKK